MRDGRFTLGAPDESTRNRVGLRRDEIEAAITAVVGNKVPVDLVVEHATPSPAADDDEEDVDLSELVDVSTDAVVSPLDRLHQAFPGSQELDERS